MAKLVAHTERKRGLPPSAVALLAANTIPILGAIFFDWSIFSLMFLFWLENVIVGLFNTVKMLTALPNQRDKEMQGKTAQDSLGGVKVFMSGFFTIHYGIFCLVHGGFVFALFGKEAGFRLVNDPSQAIVIAWQVLIGHKLIIAAATIFVSHLFSLVYNYYIKGERRMAEIGTLMIRPYGRVIVLHLTILFGGFAVMALGSPIWALVLLVVLKTGIDLAAHLSERKKMGHKISRQVRDENC